MFMNSCFRHDTLYADQNKMADISFQILIISLDISGKRYIRSFYIRISTY